MKILSSVLTFGLFGLLSITQLWAQEVLPVVNAGIYSNLREGKSQYINRLNANEVKSSYEDIVKLGLLREVINDNKINGCASKLIPALESIDSNDVKNSILSLRLDNAIDDVVVGLLFRSLDMSSELSMPKQAEDLSENDLAIIKNIYNSHVKKFQDENQCPEDAYRSLYFSIATHSKLFARQFKRINKYAYKNNLISKEIFEKIEYFRVRKVHLWPSTLQEYKNNLMALAQAFPNRVKEETVFVTDSKFGNKISLRQSLHARFSSTQIILISDVMKNLRKRLDAESVTISINYSNNESDVINLSPMEKFRLTIKLLRKEMAMLNNSNLLGGNYVTYSDVIAASYEVGYISSSEIEALAGLEEIWNPKKTKKEKVMFWAKTFGEIASVALPPPYGFISLMVIMIIDQQVADPKADPNADYNII